MNTVLADHLRTNKTFSTRTDLFFKQIKLSKLLKKSNLSFSPLSSAKESRCFQVNQRPVRAS